mmetsp:Transcript_5202/g.11488  ORF Transcript_5202/g.11488 Transcript_5202/m.11488 type:complete len:103 (+) Transcript_5202:221-529(+)
MHAMTVGKVRRMTYASLVRIAKIVETAHGTSTLMNVPFFFQCVDFMIKQAGFHKSIMLHGRKVKRLNVGMALATGTLKLYLVNPLVSPPWTTRLRVVQKLAL